MTTEEERRQHGIDLPQEGEEPSFLGDPVVDSLIESVIALGAELWIERDRRMLLESILEEKGLVARDELESRISSEAERDARSRARAELIERTLGALRRAGAG